MLCFSEAYAISYGGRVCCVYVEYVVSCCFMLMYVVYMLCICWSFWCMCVCCVYVEGYVIVMVAEFVVWQRRTTQRVRNWLYVAATQLPTVYKVIPSQILLENIFFLEYNLTFLKNEFCCYSLWLKFWLISFLFSPLQVELRTIFWWNIGHRSSASLYLRFESCAHESLMTIGKSRWSPQLTINLRSKFWLEIPKCQSGFMC